MCMSDRAPQPDPLPPPEAGNELVDTLASVIRFYVDPSEQDRATHALIRSLTDFIAPAGQPESCEEVKNRIEFLYCVFDEMLHMDCFVQ